MISLKIYMKLIIPEEKKVRRNIGKAITSLKVNRRKKIKSKVAVLI